jgi:hypothetical protein
MGTKVGRRQTGIVVASGAIAAYVTTLQTPTLRQHRAVGPEAGAR